MHKIASPLINVGKEEKQKHMNITLERKNEMFNLINNGFTLK